MQVFCIVHIISKHSSIIIRTAHARDPEPNQERDDHAWNSPQGAHGVPLCQGSCCCVAASSGRLKCRLSSSTPVGSKRPESEVFAGRQGPNGEEDDRPRRNERQYTIEGERSGPAYAVQMEARGVYDVDRARRAREKSQESARLERRGKAANSDGHSGNGGQRTGRVPSLCRPALRGARQMARGVPAAAKKPAVRFPPSTPPAMRLPVFEGRATPPPAGARPHQLQNQLGKQVQRPRSQLFV